MEDSQKEADRKAADAKNSGAPGTAAQKDKVFSTQEFIHQSADYWDKKSPDERRHYIDQLNENFHAIVDEFYDQADMGVKGFKTCTKSNLKWRNSLVSLTGGMAVINVVIAYVADKSWVNDYALLKYLPLIAAVYAAFLATLSNLEGLYKYPDKANALREVREIFLSAAREFEMMWHLYVRPFADNPSACINAAIAYRQIITKDSDIRRQVKEITERTKAPAQGSGASGSGLGEQK